ncbi:MAG: sulfite exporter TauE/SafE family protein [Planctomycetes bacterium]|nr:sulfite exporter TauE/SafE family protein [Planctomycetota bacterium]
MPFELAELLHLIVIGLLAGTAGGLLGLGGAIVMIPFLTLFMHREQHLAQAAAMIVNVFVALPALLRHHHADAVRWDVVVRMLPFGLIFILIGVEVSDRVDGEILQKVFGLFLAYVVAVSIMRLYRARRDAPEPPPRVGWAPVSLVGGTMGFFAGLLGIGGGPIAVPLLKRVCDLPLRQSVAASSAVIGLTSLVGAVRKNAALGQLTDTAGNSLGLRLEDSLWIAACIAPTAMVGALFGAGLTYRLPIAGVRVAFIVLASWVSVHMLGVL